MLRFASLGSGSKGNATLIESGVNDNSTRILLDCGFSTKELEARLANLKRSADTLTAIVITHEHSDHIAGAGRLSRKYRIPVWLTVGTYHMCRDKDFAQTHFIDSHADFSIDDIRLHPFPVPHDAREPCQFVFSDGASRLGIVTDLGCHTPHIIRHLNNLDGLMLECNYDKKMLFGGSYPKTLKERVASFKGHLGNEQSSHLLKELELTKLKHIIGVHVSEKNNTPELALQALCEGMSCQKNDVSLASQSTGFSWRELR
ncbi:MAG: MBL fold metallo-hydrolase [Cocleimonas sp.]